MNCNHEIEKLEKPKGSGASVILLVEDDDSVRELLALILRSEGHEVIELGDGMEALSFLAASSVFGDFGETRPIPDLIISDIQMPMFTGLDLLTGMGEFCVRPSLILFTGLDDPELFAEAYRLGARRILKKPLSPDVLCRVVGEVLEQDRQAGVSLAVDHGLGIEQAEQGY